MTVAERIPGRRGIVPLRPPDKAFALRQAQDDKPSLVEYGLRRYLVVGGVMLAALLQTVDLTIVNVALPTIQGNLGATVDDGTWVVTAYVIANVVVIPLAPWLQLRFGRKNYFARLDRRIYARVDAVRHGDVVDRADSVPRSTGRVRRRIARNRAGRAARHVPTAADGNEPVDLCARNDPRVRRSDRRSAEFWSTIFRGRGSSTSISFRESSRSFCCGVICAITRSPSGRAST